MTTPTDQDLFDDMNENATSSDGYDDEPEKSNSDRARASSTTSAEALVDQQPTNETESDGKAGTPTDAETPKISSDVEEQNQTTLSSNIEQVASDSETHDNEDDDHDHDRDDHDEDENDDDDDVGDDAVELEREQKPDYDDEAMKESAERSEAEETHDKEASPSSSVEESTGRVPSPTQQDLFGDADDVSTSSEGEENEEKRRENVDRTKADSAIDHEIISADQQPVNEVEAEEAETLIDVEIPKISADVGSQLHFVKFPNFLSVEPRPFDPETYEDEIDDDDVLDEEGRSRVKLKVENTIRWRQTSDPDGSNVKQFSNAKIVRWSDGSMSLYLGSEVFDVHTHPLQGDHHHLFIRQGTGLQGRAIFRTKLTFRPHSTESFTHRKMTLSMADRTNKAQKVKVLPAVGKDPEALKQELMKKEEERLRASARRESQQRRTRERMAHGRGGLSASYLEPDRGESDDENAVSISAIKRSFKSGGKDFAAARAIYASDEDEDEENESGNDERGGASSSQSKSDKKLERAKRLDSDEEDDDEEPTSADERKKRRANVVEDDEDD